MTTATFIMPYYDDAPACAEYLTEALAALRAQTDPDWQLVIVDDASPRPGSRRLLNELLDEEPTRIRLLPQSTNRGQGACRNLAVAWAAQQGSPIVLFQDADDVSHPRRLELTRRFLIRRPDVDFVYSTFVVIDENSDTVPIHRLTPSVAEILRAHGAPVEGPDAWMRIGTELGYTTLTSTVAVRTPLAVAYPFPEVRGCEDAHAWLRMSAGGTGFAYLPEIPSRYRIPQRSQGSSDRSRIGISYYRRKVEVESDGFDRAIEIATARGVLDPARVPELRSRFLRRLAATLRAEGEDELVRELLAAARFADRPADDRIREAL